MGGIDNRFNLNINPQFRQTRPTGPFVPDFSNRLNNYYGNNPNDLRNKYSVTSQFNEFNSFLRSNGMTYGQYQQQKWEAQMMAKEQQSVANQEAINSTFTNLGNLATIGKGLFDTVKGWFGKKS